MTTDLPHGWRWSNLGEVCDRPQYGWTTKASGEGDTKFLRTTDISSGPIEWSTVPYCDAAPEDPEKYQLHPGDIIISRAGSVGLSALVHTSPRAVFASYLIRFTPNQFVDSKYVAYYLQSPAYWREIEESASGIAMQNVNAKKLAAIPIPLPPTIDEQRRIVEAIETQLTRLDAAVAALKRAQANLKRYRASVLKAAVEGRLVSTKAELARQEPVASGQLPNGWSIVQLKELALLVRNGISTPPNASEGIPILRISAVRPLSLDTSDRRFLGDWRSEYKSYVLEEGDLLFTRYNGSRDYVGVCAAVRGMTFPMLHPDKLIRVKLDRGRILPEYAELALNTGLSRLFIESRIRTTAGQSGISGTDVKQTPIPLPPIWEQERISNEVFTRIAESDTEARLIALAIQRSARLRQSVLKQAFSGQLTADCA